MRPHRLLRGRLTRGAAHRGPGADPELRAGLCANCILKSWYPSKPLPEANRIAVGSLASARCASAATLSRMTRSGSPSTTVANFSSEARSWGTRSRIRSRKLAEVIAPAPGFRVIRAVLPDVRASSAAPMRSLRRWGASTKVAARHDLARVRVCRQETRATAVRTTSRNPSASGTSPATLGWPNEKGRVHHGAVRRPDRPVNGCSRAAVSGGCLSARRCHLLGLGPLCRLGCGGRGSEHQP